MPEYVCIIGLVLGVLYVGCQVVTTAAAYRTCKQTCKMISLQLRVERYRTGRF